MSDNNVPTIKEQAQLKSSRTSSTDSLFTTSAEENGNKDKEEGSSSSIGLPRRQIVSSSTSASAEETESVGTQSEDIFEVEQIIGHKVIKGKDHWKVRWVGYGPTDDTWEPRENFLDEKVLKMLNDYEAERLAKKEMSKKVTRRSNDQSKLLKEKADMLTSSSDEELDGEQNTSWFGIKPDEGTREQRKLFVPDRRLSKTEKLLTELGASPGVRMLRSHLKEQTIITPPKTKGSPIAKPKRTSRKKPAKSATSSEVFTAELSPQLYIEDEQVGNGAASTNKVINEESEMDLKKEAKSLKPIQSTSANKTDEVQVNKLELEPKQAEKTLECTSSKLGISRGLKPEMRNKKRTSAHFAGKITKQRKEDKPVKGEKVRAEKPKSKEKLPKSSFISPRETGLPLCLQSEGSDISATIELFARKTQQSFSANGDASRISQEEFEEIVMDGKVEKVRAALSADNERIMLDLNHADSFGKTLIHKLCEIKCGVSHTQCELIDLLVSNGARLDVKENNNEQIPLHIAIANRRLCHVRKLLELQSPINLDDKSGKSPLILALECSDSEFMKCLLRAGASFQPALEKLYEEKGSKRQFLRAVYDHEAQLRKALNSARDIVSTGMSVKCISPIFVNPLYEVKALHTFHLSSQPQLPDGNYAYLLFISIAQFIPDDRVRESGFVTETRMWGQSPVRTVMMNEQSCKLLKPNNKFAFFCVPCQGQNQLELTFEPDWIRSKLIVLSQVVLAQFFNTMHPQNRSVGSTVQPMAKLKSMIA